MRLIIRAIVLFALVWIGLLMAAMASWWEVK